MSRSRLDFSLLVLVLVLFGGTTQAQNRKALEDKEASLRQEISLANKLLGENEERQKASLSDIEILSNKIDKQAKLVSNYRRQIMLTDGAIVKLKHQLEEIGSRITKLELNYNQLLAAAYRQKLRQNRWTFLLSASSFNEMWRRMHYMRRIRKAWSNQAMVLKSRREEMTTKQIKLEEEKTALQKLRTEAQTVVTLQQRDKAKLDKLLNEIRSEEGQLRKQLLEKEKQRARLLKEIERIIAREMAAEPEVLPNTPLGKLSLDFNRSRGQLPWPVSRGVVTKYYGQKRHPVLPNVTTSSNGIDIRTSKEAIVTAIYDGEVVSVTEIPGFDHVVIVKHGNFYSVYSYLEKVATRTKKKIKVGDKIGTARLREGAGEVHLEIWQGKELQDPLLWLTNL